MLPTKPPSLPMDLDPAAEWASSSNNDDDDEANERADRKESKTDITHYGHSNADDNELDMSRFREVDIDLPSLPVAWGENFF